MKNAIVHSQKEILSLRNETFIFHFLVRWLWHGLWWVIPAIITDKAHYKSCRFSIDMKEIRQDFCYHFISTPSGRIYPHRVEDAVRDQHFYPESNAFNH